MASCGLIEAGPFDKVQVEMMNPYQHMSQHAALGDRVWMRRRQVPLSPEQSGAVDRLCLCPGGQAVRPGAVVRPVDAAPHRGPIKTWFVGEPRGDRPRWFCSELVTECCVAAGIMDRATARPSATYPSDLFWGRSYNLYLNCHLDDLERGWYPPARWLPALPQQVTQCVQLYAMTLTGSPSTSIAALRPLIADHAAAGMGAGPAEEDPGHRRAG